MVVAPTGGVVSLHGTGGKAVEPGHAVAVAIRAMAVAPESTSAPSCAVGRHPRHHRHCPSMGCSASHRRHRDSCLWLRGPCSGNRRRATGPGRPAARWRRRRRSIRRGRSSTCRCSARSPTAPRPRRRCRRLWPPIGRGSQTSARVSAAWRASDGTRPSSSCISLRLLPTGWSAASRCWRLMRTRSMRFVSRITPCPPPSRDVSHARATPGRHAGGSFNSPSSC